jgi:uncharacterized damage-inducible protein DinB
MSTHVAQFRSFARYNTRFNTQVFDFAEKMTDAGRREDRGAFFGSVHRTLNHILLADRIWLERFRQNDIGAEALAGANLIKTGPGVHLDDELYVDWRTLREQRAATDAVIEAWVAALSPATLEKSMTYGNSKGVSRTHAAWIAIAHLFNHQTHHRGQVTTLLFQAGHDPGVTDFLVFALQPD